MVERQSATELHRHLGDGTREFWTSPSNTKVAEVLRPRRGSRPPPSQPWLLPHQA